MSTLQSTSSPLDTLTRDEIVVSVVIPCLNEEGNIEHCVSKARRVMEEHELSGEVVVADNASEDRSAELAAAARAGPSRAGTAAGRRE